MHSRQSKAPDLDSQQSKEYLRNAQRLQVPDSRHLQPEQPQKRTIIPKNYVVLRDYKSIQGHVASIWKPAEMKALQKGARQQQQSAHDGDVNVSAEGV